MASFFNTRKAEFGVVVCGKKPGQGFGCSAQIALERQIIKFQGGGKF